MNGIETLWSLPFALPVAWALAHFLWQGALVGILLAGALALAKKKSPSARYAMAAGAMIVLLALPVITALSLAPAGEGGPASSGAPAALSAEETGPVVTGAVPVARESAVSASGSRLQPLLPWFFVFWLAGVAVLSVYHLGGWLQARRLERRGTNPVPERWERVVAELCRRLGVARVVRILESSRVAVPAVVGWLRPVILVPASALTGLSPQQLEAILAHELAHVRRHDYLINLLQTVVETLLFYHPAVWWVSRVVRQEREHCCDDLAVAVCGDRLVYVRALADLEGLRAPSPRLAMASDGGSLLARIRRLAGVPSGPSGRRSWLAGALALGLLPSGMVIRIGGPAEGADPAAGLKAMAIEAAAPAPAAEARRGSEQGVWTGEIKEDGRVQLQIKSRSKGEKGWGFGNSFSASDLQGLHSGRFELRRDAGTVTFEGRFAGTGPGARGNGTFSFQPDPGYIRDMASLGYRVEDKVFELALFDVSRAKVRELRSLGYGDLTLENLIEFAIFRVTPDFIREVGALGFQDLPAKRLVEMRIHRVTPEYFREMAALGYKDLSLNDAVSFRIHRVTPEFVREMAALGYENLSANDLVSFRIFKVTPEFIRELTELGYRDVSVEELTELRIHRVDSDFIREAREKEGRDLSLRELVDLKIQGHIRKARRR